VSNGDPSNIEEMIFMVSLEKHRSRDILQGKPNKPTVFILDPSVTTITRLSDK
jgi:hypothetical protein